ncbi:P-loop NTPase family protein [Lactococcus lactis]|uniref:Uncharacterized protein n=1 Tax=Lactococcus lactis subsp. lactis TaxID=1360 RepID=A0A1V0P4M4_LACLL|nr:hypothetical protein [Lactococcus lactis]ARE21691.1 hypothetical protein LLUC06_2149 [Lactococcus lactis subsp. lactis]
MRDRSADERLMLGPKILFKENQIDEINREYRNQENQLERFHSEMNRLFNAEEELYFQAQQEGENTSWKESEFQAVRQEVQRVVSTESELIHQGYGQARLTIQDNIDQLHKERNALPWD